uniref:Ovule protein n=1 Tax=Strongyloides venezuelensis TaxID=75913 RepID=A0A0K0FAN9_STRVS
MPSNTCITKRKAIYYYHGLSTSPQTHLVFYVSVKIMLRRVKRKQKVREELGRRYDNSKYNRRGRVN